MDYAVLWTGGAPRLAAGWCLEEWRGSSAAQFNLVCFPLESSKLYIVLPRGDNNYQVPRGDCYLPLVLLYAAFWASWFGRVAGTVRFITASRHRQVSSKAQTPPFKSAMETAMPKPKSMPKDRQTPLTKPNPETPKHEPRTRRKRNQERKPTPNYGMVPGNPPKGTPTRGSICLGLWGSAHNPFI